MIQRLKRKQAKAGQQAAIKLARGMFRSKSGVTPFAKSVAQRKAEDRELERRRDERLAALFKK